jgi:hypothetical protein
MSAGEKLTVHISTTWRGDAWATGVNNLVMASVRGCDWKLERVGKRNRWDISVSRA